MFSWLFKCKKEKKALSADEILRREQMAQREKLEEIERTALSTAAQQNKILNTTNKSLFKY